MPLPSLGKIKPLGLVQGGYPLAVDFGVGALKVLQIAPGAKDSDPPTLVAAATIDTPDELAGDHAKRLEFQTEELHKLIKCGGFTTRRAVCSIPAAQTFCKHMQVQRDPSVALQELVKAAVSSQLACHPDALVYRQIEVEMEAAGGGSGKAEVICLAASRDLIGKLMGGLRSCRLEPVGIHPECLATLHAFDYITRRAQDDQLVSLYLDVGSLTTKVIIAHGRKLVFSKTIHLAGRHFDQAAAKQLRCDLRAARSQRMLATSLVPVSKPAPTPAHAQSDNGGGGG
ncbi:MAG: hypothetical protein H7Y88_03315, partial [Phycisphaerales bacterium]|nr:hypothetical protein [Phycisphaerales bacterium]